MLIVLRTLLRGALRDRISLFYAILLPVGVLFGLGYAFPAAAYRHLLLIGMLGMSTLFFSLTGVAFEALYQRTSGVYKLLRATPYRTIAFVANLTMARGIIALLSSVVLLVIGLIVFDIHLSWANALLIFPIMILGILCFTFLGFTIGNLAQNEGQVAMLNNILTLPMIFTSATFYSVVSAPRWVQIVGACLPLSHLIDGVRAALAGDAAGILTPALFLLGFTLLSLTLAVVTFHWIPEATSWRRTLKLA